ncbi:hypothetical protein PVAP13_3NG026070 [Panicum virgatum]|uniref:Uncharacterized protein n=1 Tax=Panicum virgatum TaxID=38727 RepID=A0A8T0U093_PANVG|nr:hypothetical protein PVAP13_3NG026070 [Panicum virgatum]KAG2615012.1 hypothetical protein PVAP13_3NG026070 [Panicum virgatum]KAG2615013.1 hypothetical protein PVAP13_3NG026070 [Panicum virgatum]KAG2615015.1 hypothetical protein PVAP13_3NG026070 [Panicum virgatum]
MFICSKECPFFMHSIGLQFIKFGPTWCLGRLTFSAEDLIGLMALLFFQSIDHLLALICRFTTGSMFICSKECPFFMHSIGLQFIKFGPTWCLGRLTFSAEDLIGLMALLFFQSIDHLLALICSFELALEVEQLMRKNILTAMSYHFIGLISWILKKYDGSGVDHAKFCFQVCCETVVPTIPIIFHRTKAICSAYGQTVCEACFNNALPMTLYYKMSGSSPNKQEVDTTWSLFFVIPEGSSNDHGNENGMTRDSCAQIHGSI